MTFHLIRHLCVQKHLAMSVVTAISTVCCNTNETYVVLTLVLNAAIIPSCVLLLQQSPLIFNVKML